MAVILYDEQQKQKSRESLLTEGLLQIPKQFREKFRAMMEAELDGKFTEMIRIGQELEAEGCREVELYLFLSRGYLSVGKYETALRTIEKAAAPHMDSVTVILQMAVCHQTLGHHNKTVELLEPHFPLPEEEYIPFFYSTYGFSLTHLGRLKEARESYQHMVEQYHKGNRPGSRLMDGVFQQMIEIDMVGDLPWLPEDMEAYAAFIKGLDGTDEEQEKIAENLVLFAHYIDQEAYRPLFRKLLDEVAASGIMKNKIHLATLHSGYVALESYRIHEEGQVSEFMVTLLFAAAQAGMPEAQMLDDEVGLTREEEVVLADMKTELLLHKYYAEKRLPGILEEFSLAQKKYPEHYRYVADFVQELRADSEVSREKYLAELLLHEKETLGMTRKQRQREYDMFYKERYESGTLLWDSSLQSSYVRSEKKIGRNDPCPCGSGKKYKKCCGRENNDIPIPI